MQIDQRANHQEAIPNSFNSILMYCTICKEDRNLQTFNKKGSATKIMSLKRAGGVPLDMFLHITCFEGI